MKEGEEERNPVRAAGRDGPSQPSFAAGVKQQQSQEEEEEERRFRF